MHQPRWLRAPPPEARDSSNNSIQEVRYASPTYPVYTSRSKSALLTHHGVATSITAFVGYAATVSITAELLLSFSDMSVSSAPGSRQRTELRVQQFFQNGGSQPTWCARRVMASEDAQVVLADSRLTG